jgi:hypothetical protein
MGGIHFQVVDEVKLKMVDMLSGVTAGNLQHCFEQWKTCMQWYTDTVESAVKGLEMI